MKAAAPIGIVLSMIFAFYLLQSTYSPLETSAIELRSAWGGEIEGENLGTASPAGNLVAYTDYTPIKAGSYTVYADGTPSGNWVNATVAVTLSTGLVNVTATGPGNTTSNAVITIDYQRSPAISNITGLSPLPGVGVLLLLLGVIFGLIIYAATKTGVM